MAMSAFFCAPYVLFAQGHSDEYYGKLISFVQGEGVLEDWFTSGFLNMFEDFMTTEYGKLILFGQAIAAIGALLYLAHIGWQMQAGKEWELVPMLKPFAIGLVIMNWVGFVKIIQAPTKALTEYAKDDFNEQQAELNTLRVTRYKMQQQTIDALFEERANIQAEMDQQKEGNKSLIDQGLDMLGDGMTKLMSPLYEAYLRFEISLRLAIDVTLETVGMWILRICTYLIFFIQLMYSTVLVITGPISIGISVFPMFASSFGQWVSRFININLYGFMAYIVLKLGTMLQQFAFEAEIDRYSQMIDSAGGVKNMELLTAFTQSGTMSFGLVLICFVISGIGVLSVPSLANMVVSAGGNAGAMSKLKKAGMAIATQGASLLKGK